MASTEDRNKPNGTALPGDQPALTPIPLSDPDTSSNGFSPLVTVVGFHHARGPEIETWFGAPEGTDPAVEYNWPLLPFMALSDGAHASEEDFSYFTLLKPSTDDKAATSLFGISCTRQLDSSQLINRPADVTRSTVQKAVVVIADSPQSFGILRQRLSVVTQIWFAQREFVDTEILRRFQESLADEKTRGSIGEAAHRDLHLGMSLRELIHAFRWQTLVLLKCCLLQPKMLFFGSRCDRLCMVQFSLISLIPGLIRNLEDCADPELNAYEKKLAQATSLQSSDRSSLLAFMGLPLQIFSKGAFFGPYTPLQQLDILADIETRSYIVGSTNSLLLQQKDRYSDVLINLDEDTVNISSPSLKSALSLTAADRRWIDFLTHEVNETWDEANPSRPKNMQYVGSEEFIRSQFEDYLLGLLSSVKYYNFLASTGQDMASLGSDSNPAADFGQEWVEAWAKTENYRMWNAHTGTNLFGVSEPKHPCPGGLTIEDMQRRVADQIKDLHLDERIAQGRDMLGRNIAAGREKASTMLNKLYSDVEYLRESQRRRGEEGRLLPGAFKSSSAGDKGSSAYQVDLAKAQQTVNAVGAKATAVMSSFASWAGEKRKGGGWGASWTKKGGMSIPGIRSPGPSPPVVPIDKDYQMIGSPVSQTSLSNDERAQLRQRPLTQASFSESILSKDSSDRPPSPPPKAVPAPAAIAPDAEVINNSLVHDIPEKTASNETRASVVDQPVPSPQDVGLQHEDIRGAAADPSHANAIKVRAGHSTPGMQSSNQAQVLKSETMEVINVAGSKEDENSQITTADVETPAEKLQSVDHEITANGKETSDTKSPIQEEAIADAQDATDTKDTADNKSVAKPTIEMEDTTNIKESLDAKPPVDVKETATTEDTVDAEGTAADQDMTDVEELPDTERTSVVDDFEDAQDTTDVKVPADAKQTLDIEDVAGARDAAEVKAPTDAKETANLTALADNKAEAEIMETADVKDTTDTTVASDIKHTTDVKVLADITALADTKEAADITPKPGKEPADTRETTDVKDAADATALSDIKDTTNAEVMADVTASADIKTTDDKETAATGEKADIKQTAATPDIQAVTTTTGPKEPAPVPDTATPKQTRDPDPAQKTPLRLEATETEPDAATDSKPISDTAQDAQDPKAAQQTTDPKEPIAADTPDKPVAETT